MVDGLLNKNFRQDNRMIRIDGIKLLYLQTILFLFILIILSSCHVIAPWTERAPHFLLDTGN